MEVNMHFYDLQMFAAEGGTTSGLSGDFEADFARYVSHTESAKGQDAAVNEEQDANTVENGGEDARSDVEAGDTTENTPDAENASDAKETAENADMSEDEFEKLIKGKGKKAFGARTQKIIDSRFAKVKGQLSSYDELAAVLYDKYGIEAGNMDELKEAVYNDNAMFNRQAMEAGLGTQEYRDNFKSAREQAQADADEELDRQFREAEEELSERDAIISEWQRQADSVRETYPDFDLTRELTDNEDFRKLLTGERALTVEEARRLAYYDRDMAEITGKVAQSVREKTAQTIARNRSRPAEGGLTKQGGIIQRRDVQSLSDDDVLKIIDAVSKGAKISF